MFRIYDTNDDGTIDFIEFMVNKIFFFWFNLFVHLLFECIKTVYHIMTGGTPEEVLTRIFRVFDVNRLVQYRVNKKCLLTTSQPLLNKRFLLTLYVLKTFCKRWKKYFVLCSDGEITKKELKKLLKGMHGLINAEDVEQVHNN